MRYHFDFLSVSIKYLTWSLNNSIRVVKKIEYHVRNKLRIAELVRKLFVHPIIFQWKKTTFEYIQRMVAPEKLSGSPIQV